MQAAGCNPFIFSLPLHGRADWQSYTAAVGKEVRMSVKSQYMRLSMPKCYNAQNAMHGIVARENEQHISFVARKLNLLSLRLKFFPFVWSFGRTASYSNKSLRQEQFHSQQLWLRRSDGQVKFLRIDSYGLRHAKSQMRPRQQRRKELVYINFFLCDQVYWRSVDDCDSRGWSREKGRKVLMSLGWICWKRDKNNFPLKKLGCRNHAASEIS